jgi:hypothetical protein
MPLDGEPLINTAEIARLAGRKRAAVGNWKARYDDFPTERGHNAQGPLYSKAEVIGWLEQRGRLDETTKGDDANALWALARQAHDGVTPEEIVALTLVVLAAVSLTTDDSGFDESADGTGWLLERIGRDLPYAADLVGNDLQRFERGRLLDDLVSFALLLTPSRRRALAATLLPEEGQTPESLRRLMVALGKPHGAVYVPGSGTGQLVVETDQAVSRNDTRRRSGHLRLYGQEMDRTAWATSKLYLTIQGCSAQIERGDVFTDDRFPGLQADVVLAAPPFGMRLPQLEHLQGDPRWVWAPAHHIGPTEVAWIQHCLYHLHPQGRLVMVVAGNVLFSRGAGNLRRRLADDGVIEAVISLPGRLYAKTAIPVYVLVLSKRRLHEGSRDLLMVRLGPATPTRRLVQTELPESEINRAVAWFEAWRGGEQLERGPDVAVVSYEQIALNDFVLEPRRYLLSEPVADPSELEQERSAAIARLQARLREARQADEHLAALLGQR